MFEALNNINAAEITTVPPVVVPDFGDVGGGNTAASENEPPVNIPKEKPEPPKQKKMLVIVAAIATIIVATIVFFFVTKDKDSVDVVLPTDETTSTTEEQTTEDITEEESTVEESTEENTTEPTTTQPTTSELTTTKPTTTKPTTTKPTTTKPTTTQPATTQPTTTEPTTVIAISDWVKASDVPSGGVVVETEWRYTEKEYTTSSASSLAEWTKYDTKRTGWGATQGPVYSDPTDGIRNVWSEQYVTSSNYKTVYHYYRYAAVNADTGGDSSYTKYNNCIYYREIVLDYELPYGGQLNGNYLYNGWWYWKCNPYTTQQWVSDNYGTCWYYQEPVYTYYYY